MRIRMILTDNAKEFTDRLFGLRKPAATGTHEFDKPCTALNIEHRLTPPKSPQTNGMVERFNGRVEEVLQSHHFRSGEKLETTLHRYVWLYNQKLPQSAPAVRGPIVFQAGCSPDLSECLAHLVGFITRRICGEASVAFRWFFV